MRALIISFTVLFGIFTMMSCGQTSNNQSDGSAKNDSKTVGKSATTLKIAGNFDDYEIYYENKSGEEVEISEEEFKNFIVNTRDDISDKNSIKHLAVVTSNPKNDDVILAEIKGLGEYALFIKSHPRYSKGYVLTAKDIICKATNCETCHLTISSGTFDCSSCEAEAGKCIKSQSAHLDDGSFEAALFQ